MSLDAPVNLRTVPPWTGGSGTLQDDWRMWRHTFVGLAGAKGFYELMQQSYQVPVAPPAREQGSSGTGTVTERSRELAKKNQDLWFF